jgi:TrmH family RNA methyltransferase
MDLSRIDVVLVRPQRAANVAAACRALKNMGLSRLWLVDPPAALDGRGARAAAYGAWDLLDAARRAANLSEAVASSTAVVGTTARAEAGAWTPRRLAAEAARLVAGAGRLSVVFGPEPNGLRREERGLCQSLVRIPAHPAHSSLNLAQAVLVLAYELHLAARRRDRSSRSPETSPLPAPTAQLEAALGELRAGLLAIGYLNPESPERIMTELRRLLARAAPTPREVTLLRGLARQLGWAGRIAQQRAAAG